MTLALIFDLRQFRIPNFLCLLGILTGIAFHMGDFISYLSGIILPLICLFVLFYFRMLGGGDIKLFSVVGSFLGTDVIWIMIYSFLLNGIYSFIILLRQKAFFERFWYFGKYIERFLMTRQREKYCEENSRENPYAIHFTVGIWFAVMLWFLLSRK